VFNDQDPSLTYTVSQAQLKFQDTESVVSGITLTTRTGFGVPVGSYPISIAGGQAANYSLAFVDGIYNVTPSSTLRSENLITAQNTMPPASTALPSAPPPAPAPAQVSSDVPVNAPQQINLQPGTVMMRGGGMSLGTALTTPASELRPTAIPLAPSPAQALPPAGQTPPPSGSESAATNVVPGDNAVVSVSAPVSATTPAPAPAISASAPDTARVVAVRQDIQVQVGPGRSISVPMGNAFQTSDSSVKLVLTARLADGRPLPSWARFDPATGTISGTPPAGFSGNLNIVVVARDATGETATASVTIHVGATSGRN
jgi:hypothetical protein